MRNYIARRAAHSIFIILGLMALLFFAINILGDPVLLLVDENASEDAIEAMREKLGYDRPVHVRFIEFYGNALTGDFGLSIRHRTDAMGMVIDRLPNTAALALVAWGLGSLGVPLGMIAARRPPGHCGPVGERPVVRHHICPPILAGPDAHPDSGPAIGPAAHLRV